MSRGKPGRGRSRPGSRGQSRDRRGQSPRGTTPTRKDDAKKRGLGGDHVEGRQAVRELLLAGQRRTREVLLAAEMESAPILDDIIDLADEAKVPIREIGRSKFEQETRTESSQGVLARAEPVAEYRLDELIALDECPLLLVLDGITDPGNLGAILRTAECAGVTGVVLPRHRAAHLTPTVTKAAAGAIEHLRLAVVAGLPAAMTDLTAARIWTVGLDASSGDSLFDLEVADEPLALVLGSEGSGVSRLVAKRCDALVSLPMHGVLGSLNVASAAAVALYEVVRRRS
ncbi:MAG: 23S rRNA (guanosine(2251)-2'-O)-methyltransferase RlmB [Acidimicrobiales bacterium]